MKIARFENREIPIPDEDLSKEITNEDIVSYLRIVSQNREEDIHEA